MVLHMLMKVSPSESLQSYTDTYYIVHLGLKNNPSKIWDHLCNNTYLLRRYFKRIDHTAQKKKKTSCKIRNRTEI